MVSLLRWRFWGGCGSWSSTLVRGLVRVLQLRWDKFANWAGQVLLDLLVDGAIVLYQGPHRVVFGLIGTGRDRTLEGSHFGQLLDNVGFEMSLS